MQFRKPYHWWCIRGPRTMARAILLFARPFVAPPVYPIIRKFDPLPRHNPRSPISAMVSLRESDNEGGPSLPLPPLSLSLSAFFEHLSCRRSVSDSLPRDAAVLLDS